MFYSKVNFPHHSFLQLNNKNIKNIKTHTSSCYEIVKWDEAWYSIFNNQEQTNITGLKQGGSEKNWVVRHFIKHFSIVFLGRPKVSLNQECTVLSS